MPFSALPQLFSHPVRCPQRLRWMIKILQLDVSQRKCQVLYVNYHHKCYLQLDDNLPSADDQIWVLGVRIRQYLYWNSQFTEIPVQTLRVAKRIPRALQHKCIELILDVYCTAAPS